VGGSAAAYTPPELRYAADCLAAGGGGTRSAEEFTVLDEQFVGQLAAL